MKNSQRAEENKLTLQTANAAVAAADYEGFLVHCTEDTEWTFVGEQTLKGKDAVRQWMAKSYLEAPKLIVDQLIADGEYLTAVGTVSMKNEDGEWEQFSYSDVWRFQDGKMAELKAFVIKG